MCVMNNFYRSFFLLLLMTLGACSNVPVVKAYNGNMGIEEETKTIVEYCESCHIHRNLDEESHILDLPLKYTTEPFASATDCKTCHQISENFWNDILRSTVFPDGSLVYQ